MKYSHGITLFCILIMYIYKKERDMTDPLCFWFEGKYSTL